MDFKQAILEFLLDRPDLENLLGGLAIADKRSQTLE